MSREQKPEDSPEDQATEIDPILPRLTAEQLENLSSFLVEHTYDNEPGDVELFDQQIARVKEKFMGRGIDISDPYEYYLVLQGVLATREWVRMFMADGTDPLTACDAAMLLMVNAAPENIATQQDSLE